MNDEQFEKLLESAVVRNFDGLLDEMPPQEELERAHTFSERHNQRMEKLFKRVRYAAARRNVLRFARRAVTAAAVIVALFSVTLFAFSPAVRAAVSGFVISWHERYTRFESHAPETERVWNVSGWRPSYLPPGFTETEVIDMKMMLVLVYENDYGAEISITVMTEGGVTAVSNEYKDFRQITAEDGTVYHQFISLVERRASSVIWNKGGYSFAISAEIHIDELQAVAQSMTNTG